MAGRYCRTRMIRPSDVTGIMTTDPGCRMISAFSSPPLGRGIDSMWTLNTRPSKIVRISRGTIRLSMLFAVLPSGQVVQHALQVLGEPRDELHAPGIARMSEGQPRRLQKRPRQWLNRPDVARDAT